jgi:hypothetical protein
MLVVFYGLTRPITGYSIIHWASGVTPGTDEEWSPGRVGVSRRLTTRNGHLWFLLSYRGTQTMRSGFLGLVLSFSPGLNQLGLLTLAAHGGLSRRSSSSLKEQASVVPRSAFRRASRTASL